MKTQLIYLVRHGETKAKTLGIFQGVSVNEGLNDVGREQARLLGQHLKTNYEKPSVIYSSPLERALETACIIKNEIVGMERQPEIIIIPDLHEVNHGEWEGKTKEEIAALWPEPWRLWHEDPLAVAFPKGEKMAKSKTRVLKAWRKVLEHKDRPVLVVAHGSANSIVLHKVNRAEKLTHAKQDLACLNVIERKGGRLNIALLNSVAHLL